jgi:uncharacterized membrane protein YtjA (UPF0391 family)
MGIWGFEAAIDRSYPAALAVRPAERRSDFVPFYRAILIVFTWRNCREPLFRPRIISAIRARCSWSRWVRTESEAKDRVMLGWVLTFLVVALIAGILGFGGIAGASIEIAKIIFFIAVVLFLVSAVVGLARGRTQV